jgi:hypothetical protein
VDSESEIVEEKLLTTFDTREERAEAKEWAASEFVPGPIAIADSKFSNA